MARPGRSFHQPHCPSLAAASCVQDFTTTTNSGKVNIGFNVKIGAATYPQVIVNKNGTLTFVNPLGAFTAEYVGGADHPDRRGQSAHRRVLSEQ